MDRPKDPIASWSKTLNFRWWRGTPAGPLVLQQQLVCLDGVNAGATAWDDVPIVTEGYDG